MREHDSGGPPVTELEALERFDRPGPRYTSYPTAVEFHDGVDGATYRRHLATADTRPDDPLALYVHLPFCEERCRFCACHVVATPHREVAEPYLDALERELDLLAAALPRRRRLAQLHWGGGTPTYLAPAQLERLFRAVVARFSLTEGAEVAIEVDPRVTTGEQVETLARLGFNRLSLGVQDIDPDVQEAIGRHQSWEQTAGLVARARSCGFSEGVNVDLVYGLPRQSLDSFRRGLARVIELRPDRLAVYSFAFVPWLKGNQRAIDDTALPGPRQKLELYLAAREALLAAGYQAIGMDHFALPADELATAAREGRLARNFMGYTVRPASANLGLGISAIADLESGYFQNAKKLSVYYRQLAAGRLPVERGVETDAEDRLRRWVITEIMCNFRVDKDAVAERFGVDFDAHFTAERRALRELVAAGMVEDGEGELEVVGAGRLLVRNAAMAFDAYRGEPTARPTFSRTV